MPDHPYASITDPGTLIALNPDESIIEQDVWSGPASDFKWSSLSLTYLWRSLSALFPLFLSPPTDEDLLIRSAFMGTIKQGTKKPQQA